MQLKNSLQHDLLGLSLSKDASFDLYSLVKNLL